ncbi:hypothetical protein [Nocardia blacklockiae]|uniref:hypothetical protein n=1 Tax=Nocardia blacklockiae TaxID=480036 RepID=UPI001893763F|nr:hypothetical protein [Nocardia blacklockiae]MBF6175035.1 hypothetical protein [Nocardia blacklockiae]
MRTRCARLVIAAVAVASVSAGCAVSDDYAARRDVTTTQSIAPIPPPDPADYPERPVAMPTGQQVADLLPETQAQVLCAAAGPQQWQTFLGEAAILRRHHDGSCGVYTTRLRARLALSDITTGDSRPPIAGKPATARIRTADRDVVAGTVLTVRLVDDLPAGLNLRPLLSLTVSPAPGNDQVDSTESLAVQAASAVVPRLTGPGPRLPGYRVFVPTPPSPGVGISDLAVQVRSNRLCTVALDIIGPLTTPADISPENDYCLVAYSSGARDQPSSGHDAWWSYGIVFDPQTNYSGVESLPPGELLRIDESTYVARLTTAPGQPPLRIIADGDHAPLPVPSREFAQRVVNTLLYS